LQALACELRVGRVCGRASGHYPAADLLVRYDLYGVSIAYRFGQESILTVSPGVLAHGLEGPFTRAILRDLRTAPSPEVPEANDGPVSTTDALFGEAWNRSLHRGF
jgi:hypothetical protein